MGSTIVKETAAGEIAFVRLKESRTALECRQSDSQA